MEHLVADVHVVLMAIVSAVDLGFSRPRRAVPLDRLGRQSRVVRILPGLPFLLAAIALLFFIIIPGDLLKRDRFVTCTVTPARCSGSYGASEGRRRLPAVEHDTDLDVALFPVRLPLPILVFALLLLAGGVFLSIVATVVSVTAPLAISVLVLLLFLFVSAGEESKCSNIVFKTSS